MPLIFDILTGCNQPDFDGPALAQMAKEAGFDGICTHEGTPWDGTLMPWVRMPNGIYDLTKLDPRWVKKERAFKMACAERGLIMVNKYFDDYCRIKWRKYPGYPIKAHPFVENNAGINWGDDSTPIFNNWKKTSSGPEGFWWMYWKRFDPPTSDNLVEYEFHTKVGKGIKLYLDASFAIDAEVLKKYPKKTMFVRSFWNEAGFDYRADGSYAGGGKEIDHRNLQALIDMTRKAKANKPRFKVAVDFIHKIKTASGSEIYWKEQVKGYKLFLRPNNYMQESHGVGTVEELQQWYDHGFAPKHLYASSDGSPEKDEQDFYKRHRAIIKALPADGWFGAKMRVYEGWNPKDTNSNLERFFPKFRAGLFG